MSRLLDMWAGMTGTILDFAGATAPNGWLLCYGQSLLRADYPNLFDKIGTTYGSVDSTHFNLPDCRGRVHAGKDDMGGTSAQRLSVTKTGTTTSGSQTVTAVAGAINDLAVGMYAIGAGIPAGAKIQSIDNSTQVTLTANATASASGVSIRFGLVDSVALGSAGGSCLHTLTAGQGPAHTHTIKTSAGGTTGTSSRVPDSAGGLSNTTESTGNGEAHPNLQPTIVFNKIIKA